jgi:hypothetical protein
MIRMFRKIGRWLGTAALALSLASSAAAQPPQPKTPPEKTTTPAPSDPGPPVGAYAFAVICTMIILFVICMPSRKR